MIFPGKDIKYIISGLCQIKDTAIFIEDQARSSDLSLPCFNAKRRKLFWTLNRLSKQLYKIITPRIILPSFWSKIPGKEGGINLISPDVKYSHFCVFTFVFVFSYSNGPPMMRVRIRKIINWQL